jgi:hypothetical protein
LGAARSAQLIVGERRGVEYQHNLRLPQRPRDELSIAVNCQRKNPALISGIESGRCDILKVAYRENVQFGALQRSSLIVDAKAQTHMPIIDAIEALELWIKRNTNKAECGDRKPK